MSASVFLGGWLTIKGAIEIGDIQAFITYVRNFNQPINQLSQSMNVFAVHDRRGGAGL